MSTWNVVTIHNPGDLTIETLPDALSPDRFMDGEIFDEREGKPEVHYGTPPNDWRTPAMPGDPNGDIRIEWRSKYSDDEAQAACAEIATGERTVTHFQEWDDDEVGQSLDAYRNGIVVEQESQNGDLVPRNLDELVKAVRDALADRTVVIHETGKPPRYPLEDAARALVDALRPEVKS